MLSERKNTLINSSQRKSKLDNTIKQIDLALEAINYVSNYNAKTEFKCIRNSKKCRNLSLYHHWYFSFLIVFVYLKEVLVFLKMADNNEPYSDFLPVGFTSGWYLNVKDYKEDNKGIAIFLGTLFMLVLVEKICESIKIYQGNKDGVRNALDLASPEEKMQTLNLLNELEINPDEHTLKSLIECLREKKKECNFQKDVDSHMAAFQAGMFFRLAGGSPIFTHYYNHPLADKKAIANKKPHPNRLIFQYAGLAQIPIQEKMKNIKSVLKNSIFLTEFKKDIENEKDKIVENVLGYLV